MDEIYTQEVVRRFYIIEKECPDWDHYSLKYLWLLLDNSHDPFEYVFDKCFARQNWQELNNFFYQHNRLNIFPPFFQSEDPSWHFLNALTAIAVGDYQTMEYIFPANMKIRKHNNIYPLYKVGDIMLAGLWYQNTALLSAALPKAKKYIAGKWPKWERAAIAYLLALYEHDIAAAGEYLENACKIMHTDLNDNDKKVFSVAHGLYQLAEKVLGKEEFQKLSMPEYKTFSRDYAKWRNTCFDSPQLYIHFPEPVSFINDLLTADWNAILWKPYESYGYPMELINMLF